MTRSARHGRRLQRGRDVLTVLEFECESAKLRLWLDELPKEYVVPNRALLPEVWVEAASACATHTAAAVELRRHVGGMIQYGLLGGVLKPGRKHSLSVRLPRDEDGTYSQFCGFVEYLAAIIPTIEQMRTDQVPAGSLAVKCIAHDAVGSSISVFRELTQSLLLLLTTTSAPRSFDDALNYFPAWRQHRNQRSAKS